MLLEEALLLADGLGDGEGYLGLLTPKLPADDRYRSRNGSWAVMTGYYTEVRISFQAVS